MKALIISLGSNLGDRHFNLSKASQALEKHFGKIISESSYYQTEPVGFESNNLFLNSCLHFETNKTPEECLRITQLIEKEIGRKNKSVNGAYSSRIIDIDILFLGEIVVSTPDLNIPHPELYNRYFVLEPLKEILPDFKDVKTGMTIAELHEKCKKPLRIEKIQ